MQVLNPAGLYRADLQRLGKYLAVNGVKELRLIRKDGVQIVRREPKGWRVRCWS